MSLSTQIHLWKMQEEGGGETIKAWTQKCKMTHAKTYKQQSVGMCSVIGYHFHSWDVKALIAQPHFLLPANALSAGAATWEAG